MKFSVIVLSSLTWMLLWYSVCADRYLGLPWLVYLLCRFYFASIFSCFVMAALYVTDITRSVLTGSTLPFFGILLWLVIVRLCGPVLRECIAILSRQFPPLPASNGDWLPAHDRPISKGSFISRSFLAELGLSRFIIRLVVPSTLSVYWLRWDTDKAFVTVWAWN